MSHSIPSYYRYVSSIIITNPGSGYNSNNPPTITISGGGGTGATASCEIVNGEINSVTVTNIGTGYTSTPIVTVSGSGGAVLSAVLNFAQGSSAEYPIKSRLTVADVLPEFVTEYHPLFVSFLNSYYDWMDQEGNPAHILHNKDLYDIDHANDSLIDLWALQLAKDFPVEISCNKKLLYKHAKNIYESKGSKESIKAFFRLLFNTEVDVEYTSKYILRASDGIWIQEKAVKALQNNTNYEVLNLQGTVGEVRYYETIGSVTIRQSLPVTISRIGKIAKTKPQVYDVRVSLPPGITSVPGPGANAVATATVTAGAITSINIVEGGSQYLARPIIEIYDTAGGSGAQATATVNNGSITKITVNSGGSGYVDGSTITINFNTDSIRTHLYWDDPNSNETEIEKIRAYLSRTLTSVSAATYSGSETDAGFRVGQVFVINETGDDGRGYAFDYFLEDYVYIGGDNQAYVRVRTVNENFVPQTWEIIESGSGFYNASTDITLTSRTGEDITVTITTGYLYQLPGNWKDDRGKLSDVNKLQDNYKYQSYSYVIKSSIEMSRWGDTYRKLLHPAGMEVFGDLIITNVLDYSNYITVVSDGIHIFYFETDDVVTITETKVIHFTKVLTETEVVSDSVVLHYYLVKEDNILESGPESTIGANDFSLQTYFAEDYLDNELYVRQGGVSFSIDKVLNDISVVSQELAIAMDYYRSFVDTATVNDTFSKVLNILRDYYDGVNISDTTSIVSDKVIFDTATTTENITSFDIEKVLTDTGTISEIPVFSIEKPLTELTTNTDNSIIITNKVIEDSNSAVDLVELNVTKILTHNVHSDDATLFFVNLEKAGITDDATHSENVSINNNKNISEAPVTSETLAKNLSRGLSETTTTSDSGVITIQDFADPTYFAEDYVGNGFGF